MATLARRGRARPDAARRRPASASASRWPGSGSRCPDRGRRRSTTSCCALLADEVNVKTVERHRRRVGARRAAGQAAPAEDRQAARVGDPGGHGRRARGRRRVPRRRLGDAGRRRRWRADEVEIQATPRPGPRSPTTTASSSSSTRRSPRSCCAEGDARELHAGHPGPAQATRRSRSTTGSTLWLDGLARRASGAHLDDGPRATRSPTRSRRATPPADATARPTRRRSTAGPVDACAPRRRASMTR